MAPPTDAIKRMHQQAEAELAQAKSVLRFASQELRDLSAKVATAQANVEAMELHDDQDDLLRAQSARDEAEASQSEATERVHHAKEKADAVEKRLIAVVNELYQAETRQATAEKTRWVREVEARWTAEEEARQAAEAQKLKARQFAAACQAEEVRKAETLRAAGKQDREKRKEAIQEESRRRQEAYQRQQQAKQQREESNKRRRSFEDFLAAWPPPPVRAMREKAQHFHDACAALKEDKSQMRSFPEPPYEPCLKPGCLATEKTRALKACRCNIEKCFLGRPKATLKTDRVDFHPDKFSKVPEDVRKHIQLAAKEVFSVVQDMYINA
ncbi:hypothetical protein LTR56_005271 [Elasticomyces elasticus]|nr:hypothetical protein LTR56_005271 [Elasticomyces elasticus]